MLITFVVAVQLVFVRNFVSVCVLLKSIYILLKTSQSDCQQAVFISPIPIILFGISVFTNYVTTFISKVTVLHILLSNYTNLL